MESYKQAIENLKKALQKICYVKLHLTLLPGESFCKDKFQIKPKNIGEIFTFYIAKNPYNYNYYLESLFYEYEQECLFKNLFNFYQKLVENHGSTPYACSVHLVNIKILNQMEKHKLIHIHLVTENEIIFSKKRSFHHDDLFFLMPLLEKFQLDLYKFKFQNKENKIFVSLKNKIILEELKEKKVQKRLTIKREELQKINAYYKKYIFNNQNISPPTYRERSFKR